MSAKEKVTSASDEKERYDGPIICPGHSRPIPDLAYSQVTPDGYFLGSACLDGKPMIREGTTGDWVGTLIGHKGAVWCIRLNAEATRAVTASGDFTAKIWDAVSGGEIHSFTHKHIVKAATFNHDSSLIYTGGQEKKLRIYDLNKPDAEPQVCSGHGLTITHITIVNDPHLLLSGASGGDEKQIRVWDKRTMTTVKTLDTQEQLTSFQVSSDGSMIAAATSNSVLFFDSKKLTLVKKHKMSRKIECVAYHPFAKFFVTGSSELWARAYDFNSGDEIAINKGHHGPVRCLAFNPSGDAYASGSEDGTIRMWEWQKEKQSKEKEGKEKTESADGDLENGRKSDGSRNENSNGAKEDSTSVSEDTND